MPKPLNPRKVFKYTLPRPGDGAGYGTVFELEMVDEARPLSLQMQDEYPCLWVSVDPALPTRKNKVVIVGTGWEVPPEAYMHLGTWQDGPFVWHAFCLFDKEESHANAG